MAKTKYVEKEEDPKRPTPVTRDGPYVMMLVIALVAMIAGCVLLYLDNEEYGGKTPPKETVPNVQPLGSPGKAGAPAGPGTPAP